LWGDPGHTRAITRQSLTFLSQQAYKDQENVTAMTDYRDYWRGDLPMIWHKHEGNTFAFMLRAIK
jgi:hypothetical protein